VNVVDSSGWVEFFTDGPNASLFAEPVEDLEALVVPTISVLEVFKFVLRHRDETSALEAATAMRQGRVVDLDSETALLAAKLGIDHGLPLADSVIYATAQREGAEVWTQDSDFRDLSDVRFISSKM